MMLSVRHLTLKLRSQSLNEETILNNNETNTKSDLDRDSGTESDDEFDSSTTTTGDGMDGQDGVDNGQRLQQQQRFTSGRERTRSESGKENAAINPRRPAIMTSRHRRERTGETAMAARLAVVATLSSREDVDDCTLPFRRQSTESPIEEFLSTDSAVPSDSDHGTTWNDRDHHSSEEELECINGYEVDCDRHRREESVDNDATPLVVAAAASGTALRFGPSAFGPPRFGLDHGQQSAPHRTPVSISSQGPEKRKWGQVNARRSAATANNGSVRPRSAVLLQHHSVMLDVGQSERSASSSAASAGLDCSSDDEVQSLVGFSGSAAVDSPLPLEFRSSPPEGAHRPTRSLSPPPKFFLADQDMAAAPSSAMLAAPTPTLSVANGNGSPRKRHRHHAHRHHHMQQRPCLDFEKMQQMKNRSVSTWRHDGELSLFCW